MVSDEPARTLVPGVGALDDPALGLYDKALGLSLRPQLLLLDDEENILRSLVRLFRRDGYRILAASNVTDAFELLATNDVQVILSDQRMSDMSGTEFLGRVRMLYPDTVRLVLSGYTDLATVTEAINRGEIYRFLTKPWNDDDLREHIRQAFTAYENQPHHRAHA